MGTRTVSQPPALISSPTHVWTPSDVFLDSPVWRANIIHLEEQIDHFERWVEGFTKSLKQFIDVVKKYNAQLSNLCKKTLPHNLDGSLIDPEVAGMIINTFASTLQCNLAIKTKMVSDLEETLLHPLQQFTRLELKDFKEERKAYERMVDRCEAQLYRYAALSKSKEASALREDAFQTYEVRKSYTRLCRDYYIRIVAFKANLEHALVECFSSATATQVDEANEAADSCAQTKSMLPGWRQWLEESKATSEYQLQKINKACLALENTYIRSTRPHRSLTYYYTVNNGMMTTTTSSETINNNDERSSSLYETYSSPSPVLERSSNKDGVISSSSSNVIDKGGYLYTRITVGKPSRYSWVRRWFFLQDGWFGICTVSTVNKVKGCVVVGERVPVDEECKYAPFNEIDRRFCFEVIRGNNSFLVQAETEDEMQDWIRKFEKQRAQLKPLPPSTSSGQPLLSTKAMLNVTEEEEESGGAGGSKTKIYMTSNSPSLQALSLPPVNPREEDGKSASLTTAARLISVLLHRDPSNEPPLPAAAAATDDTREPSQAVAQTAGSSSPSPSSTTGNTAFSSSWSMPWIMSALSSSSGSSNDVYFNSGDPYISSEDTGALVIWPTKFEVEAPVVNLNGYTGELASRQRELRKLFANVPSDEIVVEAFPASLYRRPGDGMAEEEASGTEYGYNGYVYITQRNFWFYSCSMMTCIKTLLVPLDAIKSVKVERVLSAGSYGMLMHIETSAMPPSNCLCFGVWLVSAEAVAERLRIAVQEAKKKDVDTKDLQTLYDLLRKVKRTKTKSKPITNVTPVMASDTAITPVTVQAQQSPSNNQLHPLAKNITSTTTPDAARTIENLSLPASSSSSPPSSSSPSPPESLSSSPSRRSDSAVNALTAAMEQASDAKKEQQERVEDQYQQQQPCGCTDHLEKVEAQVQFKMSAKQLFELLFSEKQSGPEVSGSRNIWAKLNVVRNRSEPKISNWTVNAAGEEERQLKYTMPVNNPMVKARETNVVEIQQIVKKEESKNYVVISTTKTLNLLYADAFLPLLKFCITSTPQEAGCTLTCSAGVKWYKSIMVKSIVSRAAMKGMSDTIQALIPLIQQEQKETSSTLTPSSSPRPSEKSSVARDNIVEPATASASSQQVTTRKPSLRQLVLTGAGWIVSLCVVLFLLWMRQGSRKDYEAGISSSCDHHKQQQQPVVMWRAVFLRDLVPHLLGQNISTVDLDLHINPILYKAFLDSRKAKQRRAWFTAQHQLMDNELSFTRGKLASLRYDLLTAFKALNDVERAVIENEYWNWIIDERKRCEQDSNMANDNSCKQIPHHHSSI